MFSVCLETYNLKVVRKKKVYTIKKKYCSWEPWVDRYRSGSFFSQMLVICMSGFFQEHVLSWAHNSKSPICWCLHCVRVGVWGSSHRLLRVHLTRRAVSDTSDSQGLNPVLHYFIHSPLCGQRLRTRGHLLSVSSYSQCYGASLSPGPFGFLEQRRQLKPVVLSCPIRRLEDLL